MPLLDYRCTNIECREKTEVLVKDTETAPSESTCPKCGSKNTKIVFNKTGVKFVGFGFSSSAYPGIGYPTVEID